MGPKAERKFFTFGHSKVGKSTSTAHDTLSRCFRKISAFNTARASTAVLNVLHEPSQSKARTTYAQIECKKLRVLVTIQAKSVVIVVYMLMSPEACGYVYAPKYMFESRREPQ